MIGLVFAVIVLLVLAWAAQEYLPGPLGLVIAAFLVLLAAYLLVVNLVDDEDVAEAAIGAVTPALLRLRGKRLIA